MPRASTPSEIAARLKKWADAGFEYSLVEAGIKGLEVDRKESVGRAPKRSGRLAASIRGVRPSSRRAAKKGVIRFSLVAGRRSGDRRNRVEQANIIQTGGSTKPHSIRARLMEGRLNLGPVFPRQVKHPGARFRKNEFLKVDTDRLGKSLAESGVKDFDKVVGGGFGYSGGA